MSTVTDRTGRRGSGRVLPSAPSGPVRPRFTFGKVAIVVGAVLLAVVWLVPLIWAIDTSLKPEAETTRIPITWWSSTLR